MSLPAIFSSPTSGAIGAFAAGSGWRYRGPMEFEDAWVGSFKGFIAIIFDPELRTGRAFADADCFKRVGCDDGQLRLFGDLPSSKQGNVTINSRAHGNSRVTVTGHGVSHNRFGPNADGEATSGSAPQLDPETASKLLLWLPLHGTSGLPRVTLRNCTARYRVSGADPSLVVVEYGNTASF